MSAIDVAIRDVLFNINRTILKAAFKEELLSVNGFQRNLRDIITETIIYEQIIPDLSLTAGEEVWIELNDGFVQFRDYNQVVFTVPPKLIGNREIVHPIQFTYKKNAMEGYSSTTLEGGISRMINIGPDITGLTTCELKMLGTTNTILLRNWDGTSINDYKLEAVVSFDKNLSAIPAAWHKKFSLLVMLKLKAYLYNQMADILDVCESNAGVSISHIRNALERYSDADITYDEELKKWIKYANMYSSNANQDWVNMTTSFT